MIYPRLFLLAGLFITFDLVFHIGYWDIASLVSTCGAFFYLYYMKAKTILITLASSIAGIGIGYYFLSRDKSSKSYRQFEVVNPYE